MLRAISQVPVGQSKTIAQLARLFTTNNARHAGIHDIPESLRIRLGLNNEPPKETPKRERLRDRSSKDREGTRKEPEMPSLLKMLLEKNKGSNSKHIKVDEEIFEAVKNIMGEELKVDTWNEGYDMLDATPHDFYPAVDRFLDSAELESLKKHAATTMERLDNKGSNVSSIYQEYHEYHTEYLVNKYLKWKCPSDTPSISFKKVGEVAFSEAKTCPPHMETLCFLRSSAASLPIPRMVGFHHPNQAIAWSNVLSTLDPELVERFSRAEQPMFEQELHSFPAAMTKLCMIKIYHDLFDAMMEFKCRYGYVGAQTWCLGAKLITGEDRPRLSVMFMPCNYPLKGPKPVFGGSLYHMMFANMILDGKLS